MSIRARLTFALILGLLLGLSLSAADRVLADRDPGPPSGAVRASSSVALPWSDARLLAEVIQRVRDNYVDSVDDHRLLLSAVRGMVEALDEHSTFLSPDEFRRHEGQYQRRLCRHRHRSGAPGKDGVSVVRRMADSPGRARRYPDRRCDRQNRRHRSRSGRSRCGHRAHARPRRQSRSVSPCVRAGSASPAAIQGRARAGASCRASRPRC
jgi:hypothetical protein